MGQEEGMRAQQANQEKIISLLTQILAALQGAPLPTTPAAVTFPSLSDLQTMIEAAFADYALLKRANDMYVKTVDLSTANTAPTELTDLQNSASLTIFLNTGTFTLFLHKADQVHQLTISPLTYPQTLLIDWMDIDHVYIQNAAQSSLSATIIKFFRA